MVGVWPSCCHHPYIHTMLSGSGPGLTLHCGGSLCPHSRHPPCSTLHQTTTWLHLVLPPALCRPHAIPLEHLPTPCQQQEVSCGCAIVVGACQAQHCRLGWGVNSFAGAHSVAQAPGLSPKVELGGSVAKLLPPSIHPYHAQGLRPWPDSALWGQPVSPQ